MPQISSATTFKPIAFMRARSATLARGRALLLNVLVWTVLSLFQSLARYSDLLRTGRPASFLELFSDNLMLYVPWMIFGYLMYALLLRSKANLMRPSVACASLAVASVLFMVPYETYLVLLQMNSEGVPLADLPMRLRQHPAMFAFIDYVLFLGCFSFIYALAVFQRTLIDERRRQRMEAENLSLRLEVEQSRLATLRGQLEPHFLFNALNALSALVRGSEQNLALSAIQRLSELLRYAIATSGKEWTTIAEELEFVEDYVELQRLRYGSRLQLRVDGVDSGIGAVECPPLLLQPLIENALRHDLDVGSGISDIRIVFTRVGNRVEIVISNPLSNGARENGGTGIGLRNLRGRLALVYGDKASIETSHSEGRFVVELKFPVDGDE